MKTSPTPKPQTHETSTHDINKIRPTLAGLTTTKIFLKIKIIDENVMKVQISICLFARSRIQYDFTCLPEARKD